jgi:hypothetical protein
MDQRLTAQLDKILALADSSHDGEALGAVRMARQMLSKDGLSFGDLARAASTYQARRTSPFSLFSGANLHLETQLVQLRQRLDDLQAEKQAQDIQMEFWRQRASELEQNFNVQVAEVERWRKLARETVEKLWDLGQYLQTDELAPDQTASRAPEMLKTGARK